MSTTEPQEKLGAAKTVTNLLVGLVVLVAGLALIFGMVPDPASTPGAGRSGSPATSQQGTGSGGASRILLGDSIPTAVSVPSISANSSLVRTGIKADGALEVPPVTQPMQASWFDKSPSPGEIGPAIILGHVNGNGKPGIFSELRKVVAGDPIVVDRQDGQRATFKVTRVETIPKASFPTDKVYNDTQNSQLRLITCGGDYDAGNRNYLSNVIVYADLVSVQKI